MSVLLPANQQRAVIIGSGRLGSGLGLMLQSSGIEVCALSSRNEQRAREVAGKFAGARAFVFNSAAVEDNQALRAFLSEIEPCVIFLALSDDSLLLTAEMLADYRADWRDFSVFHSSGAHDDQLLAAFSRKSATTAVLHPLYSIGKQPTELPRNKGVCYGFSGDEILRPLVAELVSDWGGVFIDLEGVDRTAYHAGALLCAGHLTALLSCASELLSAAGLSSQDSLRVIQSVSLGVRDNAAKLRSAEQLSDIVTGPFARGDKALIAAHRDAIRKLAPELLEIYEVLGERSRELLRGSS